MNDTHNDPDFIPAAAINRVPITDSYGFIRVEHNELTDEQRWFRPLLSGRWLSVQNRLLGVAEIPSLTGWETAYCRATEPGQPSEILALIEGDHRQSLFDLINLGSEEDMRLEMWFKEHEDVALWGTLYGEWTLPPDEKGEVIQ